MPESTPSVLIIDDVLENVQLLADILGDDYRIFTATNGPAGIETAKEEDPDLILLDIMMPGMDGFETCRVLKYDPMTQSIPIVFLTAKTGSADVIRGFEMGGVDYITKPFNIQELAARVKTHIELTRSREELARLIRDKDKFFSIIAHDLRGPLGSFMSISDYVSENLGSLNTEDLEPLLREMHLTANGVYKLLENLLDWSRIQLGKINFNAQALPLGQLLDEAIQMLRSQADQKDITIVREYDSSVKVVADENMIGTVLRNLISNAVKYTQRGGQVTISSSAENDSHRLLVSVTDTGIGMSEEILEQLFDISRSSSAAGTEQEKGTGLGLILCQELMTIHGQKIWAESTPGEGSTLNFTLEMKK